MAEDFISDYEILKHSTKFRSPHRLHVLSSTTHVPRVFFHLGIVVRFFMLHIHFINYSTCLDHLKLGFKMGKLNFIYKKIFNRTMIGLC